MGAGRWGLLCEHKDYETLMRYLEALPKTNNEILLQQCDKYGGFIMQSPSAAAYAFMKTQNNKFLVNLNSVIQRCGYGGMIDQEFMKISMFNYPKKDQTSRRHRYANLENVYIHFSGQRSCIHYSKVG